MTQTLGSPVLAPIAGKRTGVGKFSGKGEGKRRLGGEQRGSNGKGQGMWTKKYRRK
jgi:hypothetical protein